MKEKTPKPGRPEQEATMTNVRAAMKRITILQTWIVDLAARVKQLEGLVPQPAPQPVDEPPPLKPKGRFASLFGSTDAS